MNLYSYVVLEFAEPVKEKYAGEEGNQKVFRMAYKLGIEGVVLLEGASDVRWDLNASSTVVPDAEIGLGDDRDSTSFLRNFWGSVAKR